MAAEDFITVGNHLITFFWNTHVSHVPLILELNSMIFFCIIIIYNLINWGTHAHIIFPDYNNKVNNESKK